MSPNTRSADTGSMFRVRSLSQGERDWNGDEIRATNCDYLGCEINANVEFDDTKIPIEYNCGHYLQIDWVTPDVLQEIQVSVDFEALIPITANVDANERQLQWRILLAAAKGMGLDTCEFEKEQLGPGDRDLQPVASSATSTLYAIRSELDASASLGIPCSKLETNASTRCIPVRSVLALMYVGIQSQGNILQEKVKNLLKDNLTNRTEELYVSDVEELRYVGTFSFVSGNGDSASADGISGDSVVRIGTLISAASAVLLVITILFFRWQKRGSNSDVDDQQRQVHGKTEVDLHSLESGPVAPTMPSNSSSDSNMAISAAPDIAQAPSNDSSITEQRSADHDEDHPTLADTAYYASRSSDSGDPATPALEAPFPLPPRPPRRGESVQLKVTRKPRKKKRKRQTLKRVNSREHVTSMEAIPETVNDVSHLDSESEYSTDDDGDGSSNFSSSTNTSPARIRSLPGSRSASPSPLGYPRDSIPSNVNFIIEALDFPFDSNSNPATRSSASMPDNHVPPRMKPVLPVKEEKKIRPIPPPWI